MNAKKYTPEKGKIIVVVSIPACNFCEDGTPGPYDFATRFGPWASGCEDHWKLYRASEHLGVGTGQLWITEDQVAPEAGEAAPGTVGAVLAEKNKRNQRLRAMEGIRIAVESGQMDPEEFGREVEALGLSEAEIEGMFQ